MINLNYLGVIDLSFLAGKNYLQILSKIPQHQSEKIRLAQQIPRAECGVAVCPNFLDSVIGFDPIMAAKEFVRLQGHSEHHPSFYHLAMLFGVTHSAIKQIIDSDFERFGGSLDIKI